jgi:phosphoglycerate dehydrogenase-like enzyme
MADAVGMRVIGFDPYAKDLPGYIQLADLEAIWRESDVISLHSMPSAMDSGCTRPPIMMS